MSSFQVLIWLHKFKLKMRVRIKKKGTFFKSLRRVEGEEDEEGKGDSGGWIWRPLGSSLGSTPSAVAKIRKVEALNRRLFHGCRDETPWVERDGESKHNLILLQDKD